MTSIDNASKLGGSDADKYRWAQTAADDCYKQRGAQGSDAVSTASRTIFGVLAFVVLGFMLFIGTWFLRMCWQDWTGIPLLDPKSPHRDEVNAKIADAVTKVESSQCTPEEQKERIDKVLGWVSLLETNKSWTMKFLDESLDRWITGGLIPAPVVQVTQKRKRPSSGKPKKIPSSPLPDSDENAT